MPATAEPGDVPGAAPLPGDREARWALVLPHADRLRRIAARRLTSDEADDVVQEALLRAVTFENLDEAYVGQFLTSVTVRLCADVQRDRTRQLKAGVRDALRTVAPGDPHDTLLDRAEARWLYDECLKLPHRESAVVLARAQGLSVREAATTLGVGVKSAEAALTKARHRMRRLAHSASVTVVAVLRRARDAAAPAAVATGLTVAYVGGVVMLDPGHDHQPAQASDLQAAQVWAGTPTDAFGHGGRAAAPHRALATSTKRAPRVYRGATRAASKPDLRTHHPIGDPRVVGSRDGVTVEGRHEEQTFEEGLMDCIGHGIVNIAPPHYGVCDHGDQ